MQFISRSYFEVFKRRDFTVLILTLLLGQVASGFLLLALINSVFSKTGSNFGVSGVVLSLALPGFLLIALAGLVADLFDRKKVIIAANFAISLVVLLILFSLEKVYASISLSFLYFAGNTFFIPATSAASGQLVRKNQLTSANSIFILALAGGQILGLFIASILHFFFASITVLIICEVLLVIAILLPLALPPLVPRKDSVSFYGKIVDIARGFIYVFKSNVIWFFFLTFAAMQGIVAFGATLGPGFFAEVMGVTIDKSPILVMPFVATGILLGALYVHNPKIRESFFVTVGLGTLGAMAAILGLVLQFNLLTSELLFVLLSLFLTSAGFGVIVPMIASRVALQKRVPHHNQGTVFGAYIILAAFLASIMSPFAALLEILIGYINVILFSGLTFLLAAFSFSILARKWKF